MKGIANNKVNEIVKNVAFLLSLLRYFKFFSLKYSNKGQIERAMIAPHIIPDKNDFKIKNERTIKNSEK